MKHRSFSFKKGVVFLIAFLVLMHMFSCKPTRWVEQGDYLLQKNTIKIENKDINKKELESYYRQMPNKKFLLVLKFHLAAYNFSISPRHSSIVVSKISCCSFMGFL